MPVRKWSSRILLAFFLSSAALWAASYSGVYYLFPSSEIACEPGGLRVDLSPVPWTYYTSTIYTSTIYSEPDAIPLGWGHGSFRESTTRWLPSHRDAHYASETFIPMWIPTALFMVAFWFTYRPYRRYKHRTAQGLCINCGYDLTGNESGVCPECGMGVGHAGS